MNGRGAQRCYQFRSNSQSIVFRDSIVAAEQDSNEYYSDSTGYNPLLEVRCELWCPC